MTLVDGKDWRHFKVVCRGCGLVRGCGVSPDGAVYMRIAEAIARHEFKFVKTVRYGWLCPECYDQKKKVKK